MNAQQETPAEFPALASLRSEFRRVAGTERSPGRPNLRHAIAMGLAVVIVGFLSLTPPGHSLAEAVGRLVGIGDEPTMPPDPGEQAVVIGVGESAQRVPYEIVAKADAQDSGNQPCIGLEFVDIEGVGIKQCLTDDSRRVLDRDRIVPFAYGAPEEFGSDQGLIVQGLTTPEVKSVSIGFEGADGAREELTAQMSSLGGELARRIGVDDNAGFFLALLPSDILHGIASEPHVLSPECVIDSLSSVQVKALDSAGQEVAITNLGQAVGQPVAPGPMLVPPPGFSSPMQNLPGFSSPKADGAPPSHYRREEGAECVG